MSVLLAKPSLCGSVQVESWFPATWNSQIWIWVPGWTASLEVSVVQHFLIHPPLYYLHKSFTQNFHEYKFSLCLISHNYYSFHTRWWLRLNLSYISCPNVFPTVSCILPPHPFLLHKCVLLCLCDLCNMLWCPPRRCVHDRTHGCVQ